MKGYTTDEIVWDDENGQYVITNRLESTEVTVEKL